MCQIEMVIYIYRDALVMKEEVDCNIIYISEYQSKIFPKISGYAKEECAFHDIKSSSVTIWLLLKWLFFIQCKGLIMKFLMIIVSKTIKWPSFEWKWNFFFFYPSINYVWVQNISFCLHCDVFIASVWGKWPFDLLGFNFRLIIMMNLISCKHLVHTSHDIKWLWKLYSYSYWLIE